MRCVLDSDRESHAGCHQRNGCDDQRGRQQAPGHHQQNLRFVLQHFHLRLLRQFVARLQLGSGVLPVGGPIALDFTIPVGALAHIRVMSRAVVGGASRAMVLAVRAFGVEFGVRRGVPGVA